MTHTLEVILANCVITFHVMLNAGQGLFEVRYVFENRTERPAVIFNLLDRRGEHPATADPSRVAIWPDGPYLDISKMAYPAPPLRSVAALYIPLASVVAPGARFVETVRVPVPFRLWQPYFDDADRAALDLGGLEAIRFRLGFFLADPGYMKSVPVTRLADRNVVRIEPYDPSHQEIAEFTMPVEGLPEMIAPR